MSKKINCLVVLLIGCGLFVGGLRAEEKDAEVPLGTVEISIPERFSFEQKSAAWDAKSWWMRYKDPALNKLVSILLAKNSNLRLAKAQIERSQIQAQMSLIPILPRISGNISANISPVSARTFQFGGISFGGTPSLSAPLPLAAQFGAVTKEKPPLLFLSGSAMLQAQWQLDLGKSISNFKAGLEESQAKELDFKQAQMNLVRQLARVYFDLASAEEQLLLVKEQKQITGQVLQLVELRFEAGAATAVDVLQQKQQVAQMHSMLPSIKMQRDLLKERVYTLLSQMQGEDFDYKKSLPSTEKLSAIGDPSELLKRRFDVRAAQSRVDAAASKHGAAWLSFLPTLGLSGAAGAQTYAMDGDDLRYETFEKQLTWNAGASIRIPIFQASQNIQNLRIAALSERMAKENALIIKRTVFRKVEMALKQIDAFNLQQRELATQLEAAEVTWKQSLERFKTGMQPYTQVLMAQLSVFQIKIQLLSLKRRIIGAHNDAYDALGTNLENNGGNNVH